ncbi:hypothetical protein EDB85DRAFT_1900437 [Lactarius pseudohatsudake]|nr:hypothetical protein EDB85DRAFT_1900437 [Lactarius pseudohatsudake]
MLRRRRGLACRGGGLAVAGSCVRRDGGLAVAGPYASCQDGGALHAMLRRRRGLACRGGGLAVAGSCARRDGGAVVAGSCKPRQGGVLGWGRAEVARVHEGAATACNSSEACLPHLPRHPNTARDPATADPPPRLPNIARKTPPPLTCPITAHKTPTANLPRFFNMAPKTPPTCHAASTRHSRPHNHRPPRHPNTARKTRRPEHKTPLICHSRSHAKLPSHMTATTMATNTRPATSWASAQATSPPLPRIFTTHKSTTTTPPHESPAPTPCGHDMQDPPPLATSLRQGPATVNPPPPHPPTPRHPDK